jgi:hypothetical protein
MKKILTLLALVAFVATANASTGDDKAKKSGHSCCAAGAGKEAKACGSKEAKATKEVKADKKAAKATTVTAAL